MTNNRIRLVTFDAMKTLIHPRESIGKIYSDFAQRRYGVTADAEKLQDLFLKNFRRYDHRWPCYGFYYDKLGNRSKSDLHKFWWTTVIRETFSSISEKKISEYIMNSLCNELYDYFETTEPWILNSSAKKILDILERKGISLAILSNFDSRLRKILNGFNLNRYFRGYFLSGEIGLAKPNVELFKLVQKTMISNSEEILHIGDDIERDYFGAKSVGWNAFLFCSHRSNARINENNVPSSDMITNLNELKEKIK